MSVPVVGDRIEDRNENRTEIIGSKSHPKRRWLFIEGIVFLLAGALTLAIPAVTVITIELLLGALLLLCGIYQTYRGISHRSKWVLLAGVLSMLIGGWLLVMPISGAVAFATLIACFLIAEGFLELVLAYELRSITRWRWLIASGLLSLVLGVVLLTGWPSQTLVLAGIFLGINFLSYGIALLLVSISIKKANSASVVN